MLLPALALLVAALFGLGLAGFAAPSRAAWLAPATLCGCVVGLVLAVTALVGSPDPGFSHLPIGLPGRGLTVGWDGLSAFFLLVVFAVGAAATAGTLEQPAPRGRPLLPVLVGAMAATLLAGDAFALVLGLALTSLATWASLFAEADTEDTRSAALLYAGAAILCIVALTGALGVLAGGSVGARFNAMRAAAPEGWRAAAVLVLGLLGAGPLAAFAPLHVWFSRAQAASRGQVGMLIIGTTIAAQYVLIRVLFDLAGPQPGWWGVPLVMIGTGTAVLGALRANLAADLTSVLAAAAIANGGMIAVGLGVALVARGADLVPLTSLALSAALFLTLAQGLAMSLLFIAADAVRHGAQTLALHRLGGLIRGMPVTTACVLAGAAAMAAVPPGPGFAGLWLLFQSVIEAARIGGVALHMVFAFVAALLGLAAALSAAAAMRLIGVAFLGRPRMPRTAAAEERRGPAQVAMLALAGASLLLGAFPALGIALAGPALRLLSGETMANRIGVLVVAAHSGAPGYTAFGIVVGLAMLGGASILLLRRLTGASRAAGERRAPPCGKAVSPPHRPGCRSAIRQRNTAALRSPTLRGWFSAGT